MTSRNVPPSRYGDDKGFTLVEVMVVLAILALLTAAVLVNVRNPSGSLRAEAETFAARTSALRDAAIIQGRNMVVVVSPSTYRFERHEQGAWVRITERPFAEANWQSGTTARLPAGGTARIVFDPTGLPSEAASVILNHEGATATISIRSEGNVDVGS